MSSLIFIISVIISFWLGRRVSREEIDILHDTAIKQAGEIEQKDQEIDRLYKRMRRDTNDKT